MSQQGRPLAARRPHRVSYTHSAVGAHNVRHYASIVPW